LLAVLNATNRTAWQCVVPASELGKFSAMKRTISSAVAPVGFLLSGVIVDCVMRKALGLSELNSFRAVFALSGFLICINFVLNIKSPWVEEFDAIVLRRN
jgi:hypothetical protein